MNFVTQHIDTIGAALFSFVFYLVIGGMIWQKLTDKMEDFEKRISTMEDEVIKAKPMWEEIRGRLIAIETSIKIHFKDK